MRKSIWTITFLAGMLCFGEQAAADVKLHGLFTSGMVLQQGTKVPIWGTADEGEEVRVTFIGGKQKQRTGMVAKNGKWKLELDSLPPGGPYKIIVSGKTNSIELNDVLVGEVWVASGQSNMEWPIKLCSNAEENIAKSANPMIRLFQVPKTPNAKPQTELGMTKDKVAPAWKECGPKTIPNFSAVAYFFARDLQKARKVPVGIIHGSWGGTQAERWTSAETLAAYPELKKLKGSDLYNGMIVPLMPFAIKGVIWYQGESNAGRAQQYRTLFPALIKNWRDDWKQGDFPFLFVQLAPFQPGNSWAELREAQLFTAQTVKNTAMAVITDAGHPTDIHPPDKDPVGARLALCAQAVAYQEKIPYSGPEYTSMKIEGDKAILSFKHVHGGLIAKENKEAKAKEGVLVGFTIAGADNKFVNADAVIVGDTVVVSSPLVANPTAVRYGWSNYPMVNLWNRAGLPATPFRTDAPK